MKPSDEESLWIANAGLKERKKEIKAHFLKEQDVAEDFLLNLAAMYELPNKVFVNVLMSMSAEAQKKIVLGAALYLSEIAMECKIEQLKSESN
jgi:predicted RNA-binding protein with PIN domain